MVSPEMSVVLEYLASNPPRLGASVAQRRAEVDAMLGAPRLDGTEEAADVLGGRPVAWIRPTTGGTGHTVLYLHGGAYEVGSITAYRAFASRIALLLDARVGLLDYRLAPEHPFPAAVDDAVAAYLELLDRGVAPSRVAVIGDSAGGGLTVALLVALARRGAVQPAAGVGLSPWLDLTLTAEAYARADQPTGGLDPEHLREAAIAYLAGADPTDPLASPVFAALPDLGALAPLLVQAGTAELLVDDASTMGDRVRAAGGEVQLELWPDLFHVWHLAGPDIPEARDALEHVVRFVTTHWH